MKRVERIRTKEAARVCLIESERLLKIAMEKLSEVLPKNDRIRQDFEVVFERLDSVLFVVVDEQKAD